MERRDDTYTDETRMDSGHRRNETALAESRAVESCGLVLDQLEDNLMGGS